MTCRNLLFSAVLLVCSLGGVSQAQPFSVTTPGGLIDSSGEFVPVVLPVGLDDIVGLEVEINGLTYTRPTDLDFYLVSPFGVPAELMTDRGGAIAIAGIDLTFADGAVGVPSQDGPIVSGLYRPEGLDLGTDGGLSPLGLTGSGGDPWILLILVDAVGGTGSFDSFTIRGVGVPAAVPAIGAWGLVLLTLVGLVAGTILFRRSFALPS
jgi:hypothetical protein